MANYIKIESYSESFILTYDKRRDFYNMMSKVKFHNENCDTNAFAFSQEQVDLANEIFEMLKIADKEYKLRKA